MTANGRILIVDDEPSLRQTLARILQRAGHAVTTAESGAQALAFLETSEFDLAYLDIRMPDMSGLDTLTAIHAAHPDLPVVLFTAQPDLNSAVEALRAGAADYLLKPLKPEVVLEKTGILLAVRQKDQRRRAIRAQIETLEAELRALDGPAASPTEPVARPPAAGRFLKCGGLVLDLHAHRLSIGERVVDLPPTSFDYLLVLARHAPEVVSFQTLVAEAQGYEAEVQESKELAKWHIHNIRQAVEADPHHPVYLFTVRGAGYRLVAD
jgi:DNA-binding response OmpR family regulator